MYPVETNVTVDDLNAMRTEVGTVVTFRNLTAEIHSVRNGWGLVTRTEGREGTLAKESFSCGKYDTTSF